MHFHDRFEIWSYMVAGELRHVDSMGHTEVIKRGDVQFTSAGTGISHSEMNNRTADDPDATSVHLLQIWVRRACEHRKTDELILSLSLSLSPL
jgi:redox-sensitive bicupin YhaK (pirin superfamily)